MSRGKRDPESVRMDRVMGEVICAAREKTMSQTELAGRLGRGWTQKKVSKIESGGQAIHLRDVQQIAGALGEDAGAMLNEAIKRFNRPVSV